MSRFWAWLNGPQNGWSIGKSNADASIERAISASASPPSRVCHRRRASASSPASRATARCIASRSPRRIRRISASLPAASPSGSRTRTRPRARASRPRSGDWPGSSASSPAATGRDRLARRGSRRGRLQGPRLVAGGDGLAGRDARLVGPLGRDPRGVGLDGEALEGRRRARSGRRPVALDRRRPPRGSRWLIRLISASQSRAPASTSSRGPRARCARRGTAAGPPPWPSARRAGRRRAAPASARRDVLVVASAGPAQEPRRRPPRPRARGSRPRSARRRPGAPRRRGRPAAGGVDRRRPRSEPEGRGPCGTRPAAPVASARGSVRGTDAAAIAAVAAAAALARRAIVIGSGSIDIGPRPSRGPDVAVGASQSGAGRTAGPAAIGDAGRGAVRCWPVGGRRGRHRANRCSRSGAGVAAPERSPLAEARRPVAAGSPVAAISSVQRRSAGPPRAGPDPSAAPCGSARVAASREWIAFGATVTRTSRVTWGRARRSSMMAAPLATPSTSPRARKANSLAVKTRCPPRPPSGLATTPRERSCASARGQLDPTPPDTRRATPGAAVATARPDWPEERPRALRRPSDGW